MNAVNIRNARALDPSDIEEKIATTATPRFLGLFRGVIYDYSLFDRFVLQRDLARVEAYYRSKGYYDAHARAGRVHQIDDSHVEVEILVEEGEPITVRSMRVDGLDDMPANESGPVLRAADAALPMNARFEEERFERAKNDVLRALTDRGYARAKVSSEARVDLVAHAADIVLEVEPGPLCVFGPMTIDGLGDLPAGPVRRAIGIEPGEPYSQRTLDSAQQAVLDLGVFATVEIKPDLEGTDLAIPVTVKVEPSRLRAIRLGGGVEFDALQTDVHGIVGWEDRNFLGGMRSFSVQLRPGVVLYPLRINNLVGPERLMPTERVRIDFRQPGLFEGRTSGLIRADVDTYPVLLNPNPPPDERVLGYLESKTSAGADRPFGRLYASLSHNVQIAYPFSYRGDRDPFLTTIVVSYPELLLALDLRDDKVKPRRGVFVGNAFQVAGGLFGGDARDVKVQPDARFYIPLARRFVLATRASVGFLLPQNYGSAVSTTSGTGTPDRAATRDYQLTFFRGFFSGGPSSNRGYPLRGVGPYALVPFLAPAVEAQRLACGTECRVPTGGFTLWEASAEIRWDVAGPLEFAAFCDASDVSPQRANIRLSHPHLSCGLGGRYDTPVGPVRVDVGYRIPGMQVLGGQTSDEQEPETFPLGIPIAISIGIGEAY